MTPRTGRPPIDDARKNRYMLRMTDEEYEKLEFCNKATGLSKAEIVRLGIEKIYQDLITNKS
ncbi:MAG: hypothetical protein ACYC5K_10705 [Saccharofermentanales bacterium]